VGRILLIVLANAELYYMPIPLLMPIFFWSLSVLCHSPNDTKYYCASYLYITASSVSIVLVLYNIVACLLLLNARWPLILLITKLGMCLDSTKKHYSSPLFTIHTIHFSHKIRFSTLVYSVFSPNPNTP